MSLKFLRGRFLPHRGLEPHRYLRALADRDSEMHADLAQAFDAWYMRTAAYLMDRKPWSWTKLPYVEHDGSQILALAVGSKGYWFLPRDVPLPRLVWLTSERREDRR